MPHPDLHIWFWVLNTRAMDNQEQGWRRLPRWWGHWVQEEGGWESWRCLSWRWKEWSDSLLPYLLPVFSSVNGLPSEVVFLSLLVTHGDWSQTLSSWSIPRQEGGLPSRMASSSWSCDNSQGNKGQEANNQMFHCERKWALCSLQNSILHLLQATYRDEPHGTSN